MKDESGLPNDCGLIAAVAYQFLTDRGVRAKLLSCRYGEQEGHIVTVFECAGRIRMYDALGSLTFSRGTTWAISPTKLAKAWARAVKWPKPITRGKWL